MLDRMFLNSGAVQSYWIGTLIESGATGSVGMSVAVDGDGNVYTCGYTNATVLKAIVAKYNASGVLQWQRSLSAASPLISFAFGIAVDASSNVYVTGSYGSGSNTLLMLVKYNSSGTLQWQRSLDDSGTVNGNAVAVDSSGNAYVFGDTNFGQYQLAKYNTSGALQWQRSLSGAGTEYGRGVAVDSSGNAYISGRYDTGSSTYINVAKYNTSGTLQWQRELSNVGDEGGEGITVDGSGNVYVTGYADTGSSTRAAVLIKYDTSGTLQWQRQLYVAYGAGVALDNSGNAYITGYMPGGASVIAFIAKYNSSGSLQWQRKLDAGASYALLGSGAFAANGSVYLAGQVSPAAMLIAKLPDDGTLTGTYSVGGVSYNYSSASLTDAAGILTSSTSTLTSATSTLTDAAGTLTDATSTLTSSVTTL